MGRDHTQEKIEGLFLSTGRSTSSNALTGLFIPALPLILNADFMSMLPARALDIFVDVNR